MPPSQSPTLKIRPAIILCHFQQQTRTDVDRSEIPLTYFTFSFLYRHDFFLVLFIYTMLLFVLCTLFWVLQRTWQVAYQAFNNINIEYIPHNSLVCDVEMTNQIKLLNYAPTCNNFVFI